MTVQVLRKALESKNFQIAIDAFWNYTLKRGTLPKKEFSQLMDLCSHDPVETHCLLKLMPYCPPSQFKSTFNTLICRLLDQNQPEHSLSFMRAVQLANTGTIDIEYETLEKLMVSAKYLGDVDFAWSAIKTMKLRYTNIYSRTWGLFLSLVLEQNHYEALEYIWNEAAIPGYLVLDDYSYTQMARIASLNGNMEMCNWAVIGITERQKYFGREPTNALQLRVYLVEASASNGLTKRKLKGSIRAACKFIVRMENDAGRVSTNQLPQFLKSLEDPQVLEYVEAMFEEMLKDAQAHEMVKLLFFNILLRHYQDMDRQLKHYQLGSEHHVELNEESVLMLFELGVKLSDPQFINHISRYSNTRRVIEHYKRAIKELA